MMMRVTTTILTLLMSSATCFSQKKMQLIDNKATKETKALFYNLSSLSKEHILFGHQHATQYGHGWYGDPDRSDVKSVTGSHPAVIGVDFSGLSGRPDSMVEKEKDALRKTIADTYNRGGVTTVAWHFNNPVSPTNFYWNDSTAIAAVKNIIPGGSYHEKYKLILERLQIWRSL
jgi:mannan endo-1,4-beta-mannosidase